MLHRKENKRIEAIESAIHVTLNGLKEALIKMDLTNEELEKVRSIMPGKTINMLVNLVNERNALIDLNRRKRIREANEK